MNRGSVREYGMVRRITLQGGVYIKKKELGW